MDGPADSTKGATQPYACRIKTNAASMVRTPSGHSPSHSKSSGGSRRAFPSIGTGRRTRSAIPDRRACLVKAAWAASIKPPIANWGREIAIKVLLSELTSDPQVIQRFKSELLLASRISHRNILRIHDLSEADGVKFITMAYVEGKDLNQVLKTEHPLPLPRCLQFARQL